MLYQPGDHVCPSDLPRRFLCRVEQVESFNVRDGLAQILKLEPLEGPWPAGTHPRVVATARARAASCRRAAETAACGGRPRRRLRGKITRRPGPLPRVGPLSLTR